ncbi:hypothetical protein SUDANB19_01236 [Streptomyces sp. enrichment culture]
MPEPVRVRRLRARARSQKRPGRLPRHVSPHPPSALFPWNSPGRTTRRTPDPTLTPPPIRATDLSGLPPAYIAVAEIDPLRDEGRNYVALLSAAGVTTELVQVPGAVHGFDLLFPSARISERSLANQVRAPNEALHS